MITDLRLQHFRSFKDVSFELSPGVNIIVGPNASGKTNILESLLVLSKGSSYRAGVLELVALGRPWARLDGHDDSNRQRTVKLVREPAPSKQYELDGKTYKRIGLKQTLPAVLFEPNHLQMFVGGPDRRREYMDDLLEQTMPGFGTVRRQYRRALTQRNHLLKQPGTAPKQLFPWNVRLSQLAGQVVGARSGLVDAINADLPELYRQLSRTRAKVGAAYGARYPIGSYESMLLKSLESNTDEDRRRGFTGNGPHREDLVVMVGSRPAQETASRGEVRTIVLALKVIELRLIESARDGQTPLLLLDDVFSELDGRRRHALTDYLKPYQTFITTTDADLVVQHFTQDCNVIALR